MNGESDGPHGENLGSQNPLGRMAVVWPAVLGLLWIVALFTGLSFNPLSPDRVTVVIAAGAISGPLTVELLTLWRGAS